MLIMAAIFINSSIPKDSMPDLGSWDLFSKKGAHFLEYAVLGAAYLRGLSYQKKASKSILVAAILLGCFYALSDEGHQAFVPGRQPAWSDVLIDTLGTAAGVMAWQWKEGGTSKGKS